MSSNAVSLPVFKVIEPRLDISNRRDYVVLKGSKVNSWQQFNATTFNNNTVQVTCNPPNRETVISRYILKKFVYSVVISGTNVSAPAAPLLSIGGFGPRAYPIALTTNSESITINNDTVTQAPVYQYWPALLQYHNDYEARIGQDSITAAMLDQFVEYQAGFGTNRNPLGAYGDNSSEINRGAYTGMIVTSNVAGATSATIQLTVIEPILISPFVFSRDSNFTSGLIGIENMSYTATMTDITRVMSVLANQGTGVVVTGVAVNLTGAALLFNYFTPDPISLEGIPRSLCSNYNSIVSYPTTSSVTVAPGAQFSMTMNSVQLTGIPRRMYIFCRIPDNLQTPFTSDVFLPLPHPALGALSADPNPLTITWNTQQFLSQATNADLFNIAAKNNYNMSFTQWNNHTGAVICLDLGADIGLFSDQAPGMIGQYQLGVTCQFVNNKAISFIPSMYVVVVYEGVFNVIDGFCNHQLGVLTHRDVLEAKRNPMVTYKQAESVYGGDFFSGIKNFFTKTIPDVVRKVAPYARQALPYLPLPPQAKAIADMAIRAAGGKRRRKRGGVLYGDDSNCGIAGGKRLTAAQMRKMRGSGLTSENDTAIIEIDNSDEIDYDIIKEEIQKLNLQPDEERKMFNDVLDEIQKIE